MVLEEAFPCDLHGLFPGPPTLLLLPLPLQPTLLGLLRSSLDVREHITELVFDRRAHAV